MSLLLARPNAFQNPPARHIVGQEGVIAVKEKIKTVSEELEDFVEVRFSIPSFIVHSFKH